MWMDNTRIGELRYKLTNLNTNVEKFNVIRDYYHSVPLFYLTYSFTKNNVIVSSFQADFGKYPEYDEQFCNDLEKYLEKIELLK